MTTDTLQQVLLSVQIDVLTQELCLTEHEDTKKILTDKISILRKKIIELKEETCV